MSLAFDFVVPGGEKLKTLVGSKIGLSDKLTKQEFLQNLFLLPVDVAFEVFLAPKIVTGILKGIKNIPKVKKVVPGIIKAVKEGITIQIFLRNQESVQKLISILQINQN